MRDGLIPFSCGIEVIVNPNNIGSHHAELDGVFEMHPFLEE
jgi:hypothetical protein